MNPVISRKYVEENYVEKKKLKRVIESELKIINRMINKDKATARQLQLYDMKAAYTYIQNIFLGGTKDGNKQ